MKYLPIPDAGTQINWPQDIFISFIVYDTWNKGLPSQNWTLFCVFASCFRTVAVNSVSDFFVWFNNSYHKNVIIINIFSHAISFGASHGSCLESQSHTCKFSDIFFSFHKTSGRFFKNATEKKCVNCCTSSSSSLSLIHIWRCRRDVLCRSRWSPYH